MDAFEKVIGYDHVKKELNKVLDIMQNTQKYKECGIEIPKGILLDGVPGVGKTLLATSFIKASGRKAYTIRKDKPDGEFVTHIRKMFEKAAENAPSIVFLDDMDKFANESRHSSNAEEYVTIQACIDQVRSEDVFVIATSNSMDPLPESLLRSGRFDMVFSLRFPKNEDAEKIISFYLKGKNVADDIDPEEIARICRGYSCADLEKVINSAGLNALYCGRDKISQNDMMAACLSEIYGVSDERNALSEEDGRRLALHEAGHAVVAEILAPGTVDFATIATYKSYRNGGMVSRNEKIGDDLSFAGKEKEIMISLAGKAATEVVLGEIDMGVNRDMHRAFGETRQLLDNVTAYGFDSWCHGQETSETVYDDLDRATAVELSRYYLKTKQLLIKNRQFLDAVADKLFIKKTITYKDINKIKSEIGLKVA